MNVIELIGKVKSGGHLSDLMLNQGIEDHAVAIHVFASKPFTIHSELVFTASEKIKDQPYIDQNGETNHYFFDMVFFAEFIAESNRSAHSQKSEEELAQILLVFCEA